MTSQAALKTYAAGMASMYAGWPTGLDSSNYAAAYTNSNSLTAAGLSQSSMASTGVMNRPTTTSLNSSGGDLSAPPSESSPLSGSGERRSSGDGLLTTAQRQQLSHHLELARQQQHQQHQQQHAQRQQEQPTSFAMSNDNSSNMDCGESKFHAGIPAANNPDSSSGSLESGLLPATSIGTGTPTGGGNFMGLGTAAANLGFGSLFGAQNGTAHGAFVTRSFAHSTTPGSSVAPKKKAIPVPDDMKDGSYWERRRKNNDSARRSRESRRMKEEQIAIRVVYLEQENLQLKTECQMLKLQIEKLTMMVYGQASQQQQR